MSVPSSVALPTQNIALEIAPKQPPRWRSRYLTLGALAILVAASAVWWFSRAPAVAAARLSYAPMVRSLQFSARVSTASRVEIGSTLTGRVAHVAVIEGTQVKNGQELIRIESEELRAAMEQARANQRQASARLPACALPGEVSCKQR